jgi:hypothetical protein
MNISGKLVSSLERDRASTVVAMTGEERAGFIYPPQAALVPTCQV